MTNTLASEHGVSTHYHRKRNHGKIIRGHTKREHPGVSRSHTHTVELPILYEVRKGPLTKHAKTHSTGKRSDPKDTRQLPIDFAGSIESIVAQEQTLQNKTYANLNEFYALGEGSLNVLSWDPSIKRGSHFIGRVYRFLQSGYYGVRQVSIGGVGYAVPHEVLISLTPAESLALNCAIYRIKVDGGIKENGDLKDISLVTINDLIQTTNRVIHKALSERDGFPGFRKMYHSSAFEQMHNVSLKERLTNLPSEAINKLVLAVRLPYRGLAYDPGIDAVPGMEGVRMYRSQISSIIASAYIKNRKQISFTPTLISFG